MPLLFLDSTGAYSDPASTNLKYFRSNGTWAAPDGDALFFDAEGRWSSPELLPKIPQNSLELDALTWEEIAQLSADSRKHPDRYMFMTDADHTLEKNCQIETVGTVKARIIGINQDVDENDNKLGFTFQLRDGLSRNKPVSNKLVNSGSQSLLWKNQNLRTTCLPALEQVLPADLKPLLISIKKKACKDIYLDGIETVVDKLPLLSFSEIGGKEVTTFDSNYHPIYDEEGECYQWYASHNENSDRIINGLEYQPDLWFLRSITPNFSNCTGVVDHLGKGTNGGIGNEWLLAACFCI